MSNIPVALQLYTLRNEAEKDFRGTLKKVAQLGFNGVEFAGYGGLEALELKNVLDDLGLKAASSHVPLASLKNELSDVIRYQQTIGNHHVVCPFILPDDRSEAFYRDLVPFFNQVGEKLAKEGITFSYHNHDFELEPMSDGVKPLDLFLQETNPEWVKAEFDIYWLTKAGDDPVEWLKKYQGRTPLVHIKDMTTDDEQFFAELGTGGVPLESVLNLGNELNVEWWVVEQDQSKREPIESVEMSVNYLKSKGLL